MLNDSKIKNVIRLGFACNVNCKFCNFIPATETFYSDFSLSEIKRQIDKLANNNIRYVSLSGGEPLLRSDIEDIIAYAKEKGISDIDLQSNAILLDEDKIMRLQQAGLKIAFISFHTHLLLLFEKLLDKKGIFNIIVRNIKLLLKHKIEVVLNPVVNQLTFKYLAGYGQFVIREFPGIKSISLSVIQPHGRALNYKKLIPNYDQLSPYLERFLQYMHKSSNFYIINPYCGVPMCIGGWSNYLKNNVEYIENKDCYKQDANKIYLTNCNGCKFKMLCNGVWKNYVDIFGKEKTNFMLKPIK